MLYEDRRNQGRRGSSSSPGETTGPFSAHFNARSARAKWELDPGNPEYGHKFPMGPKCRTGFGPRPFAATNRIYSVYWTDALKSLVPPSSGCDRLDNRQEF